MNARVSIRYCSPTACDWLSRCKLGIAWIAAAPSRYGRPGKPGSRSPSSALLLGDDPIALDGLGLEIGSPPSQAGKDGMNPSGGHSGSLAELGYFLPALLQKFPHLGRFRGYRLAARDRYLLFLAHDVERRKQEPAGGNTVTVGPCGIGAGHKVLGDYVKVVRDGLGDQRCVRWECV